MNEMRSHSVALYTSFILSRKLCSIIVKNNKAFYKLKHVLITILYKFYRKLTLGVI